MTNDSPYSSERSVAEAAAREASALLRGMLGRVEDVRDKGLHDLVTEADEAAEKLILARIKEAFPDDAVLAEESTEGAIDAKFQGRRWIVDPLDGTTNFLHGAPPYAVSIGFQDGGRMAAAAVYEIALDELFSAARGAGLTLNGKSAGVSQAERLEDSLLATGFPFRDFAFEDGYVATFRSLIKKTRGLRRPGSASVDLAYVACGRYDGFFEAGIAPWDVAAGILLIEEGGGKVEGLPGDGPPPGDPVFSGGLVASNGRIQAELAHECRPLGEAWAAARRHPE